MERETGDIEAGEAPANSLLRSWRGGRHPERWGGFADCYAVPVGWPVPLREFVTAFYTSPLFRIERAILRIVANAPSSDAQAAAVASGDCDLFAVWQVGARSDSELLMCDRYDRTRSWFRVSPLTGGGTLLQFGSAIVAGPPDAQGVARPGLPFRLLLGFHRGYSRWLLRGAVRGLRR